ncbi:MAG TPA: hypothetical protein VGM54_09990 [Chthoniobacter sp.]|jgi:hypothetical protein
MRLGVTIGFPHDGSNPVVLSGPEVPFTEQKADMREVMPEKTHEKFQRIEFFDLHTQKRKKFPPLAGSKPAAVKKRWVPTIKELQDAAAVVAAAAAQKAKTAKAAKTATAAAAAKPAQLPVVTEPESPKGDNKPDPKK